MSSVFKNKTCCNRFSHITTADFSFQDAVSVSGCVRFAWSKLLFGYVFAGKGAGNKREEQLSPTACCLLFMG